MLTIDEALEQLAREVPPPRVIEADVGEAAGCVLAEDVAGDLDMPPFDRATMDGYAVVAADTPGELEVLEEIPAGRMPARAVGRGQCSKVMTGAPVPEGADAVVPVEKTRRCGGRVRVEGVQPGQNVQPRGEDLRAGQTALRAGQRIRPQEIAVLCACGRTRVKVYQKPSVAVLATGDELVMPSVRPSAAQIRNSNSPMVCAQVRAMGLECRDGGIVADDPDAIRGKIREWTQDVLILSGGVSAGDYDYVVECLKAEGVECVLHRVRIKPGKPFFFGRRGRQRVFGLPGNPVASFVTFEVFVRPFLGAMMGWKAERRRFQARLLSALSNPTDRVIFTPARVRFEEEWVVEPIPSHGSADIFAVTRANCFVILPVQHNAPAGARVDVMALDDYNP